jgi:hypothetical protein
MTDNSMTTTSSVEFTAQALEALFLIFKNLSSQQLTDMGLSVETANKLIIDFSILSQQHEAQSERKLKI